MTKLKLLAGIAGALAISVGVLGSVSSAQAENIRRAEPAPYGYSGNQGGSASRGEHRINRAERRIQRSERRINRGERRIRRQERGANRGERRIQRSEPRINRGKRRIRRQERRVNRGERRVHRYERRRHGNRFRNRRGGYTHFYDGFYYSSPWWLYAAPVITYGASDWDLHVEWCHDRYRSYDERRDAYMGYDGYWHRCISPYS